MRERGSGKGRFVKWEIVEPRGGDAHVLTVVGPVTVRFTLEIYELLPKGTHGIALFNHDRQLIWGWAAFDQEIAVGEHEFCYRFPMLPLRPGAYSWAVSLYDDLDEVDAWECMPELVIATENHQHRYDEWNGVLNIPSEFSMLRKPTQSSGA